MVRANLPTELVASLCGASAKDIDNIPRLSDLDQALDEINEEAQRLGQCYLFGPDDPRCKALGRLAQRSYSPPANEPNPLGSSYLFDDIEPTEKFVL